MPFDPYEERRRRLMAQQADIRVQAIPPPQIAPPTIPPPQNREAIFGPAPTASQLGPMPLAPEQLQQQEILAQQPQREDFQPGMFRKILASAAGGATGWQAGAPAGIEAGRRVTDLPFERAMETWEQRRGSIRELSEMEQVRREEERAGEQLELQRRGLDIQERGVSGRNLYYAGMGEAAQKRGSAWAPTSQEEAESLIRARIPPPVPPRPMILGQGYRAFSPTGEPIAEGGPLPAPVPRAPTAVESRRAWFEEDREGYLESEAAGRAPSLSVEERVRIAEAGPKATAAGRPTPGIDPTDYNTAQQLATRKVLSDPVYAEFMEWEEGVPGLTEPDPNWDQAKMRRYYDLLDARDEETERLLSLMSSGQRVLPPKESDYEGGIVRD